MFCEPILISMLYDSIVEMYMFIRHNLLAFPTYIALQLRHELVSLCADLDPPMYDLSECIGFLRKAQQECVSQLPQTAWQHLMQRTIESIQGMRDNTPALDATAPAYLQLTSSVSELNELQCLELYNRLTIANQGDVTYIRMLSIVKFGLIFGIIRAALDLAEIADNLCHCVVRMLRRFICRNCRFSLWHNFARVDAKVSAVACLPIQEWIYHVFRVHHHRLFTMETILYQACHLQNSRIFLQFKLFPYHGDDHVCLFMFWYKCVPAIVDEHFRDGGGDADVGVCCDYRLKENCVILLLQRDDLQRLQKYGNLIMCVLGINNFHIEYDKRYIRFSVGSNNQRIRWV